MDFIVTQNGVLQLAEENVENFNIDRQVYEVIRMVDGIALFLEDHYERLISSVRISGLHLDMDLSAFRQNIAQLTILNQQQNGNVKFILSEEGKVNYWSFSYISHSYPSFIDYQTGVATGLLFAERENPNAKVIQNKVREKANQLIGEKKLYEVLLVDRNGMITEGSRSNVFFVKDKSFYTAPTSNVLEGITRKKVLECLEELNFTIIEKAVPIAEIGAFDAVFLTGTSPKVLPVNCIDTNQFPAKNAFVEQLKIRYDLMIDLYLESHKA